MSGCELALAVSLIVAPPGTPLPEFEREEWPKLQTAIGKVAIDWELMDPREAGFMFKRVEELRDDMEQLRGRYIDLKGAPLVNDGARFPERSAINEMLAFNRALREHIQIRQHIDTDRASACREAIHETDKLYQVWDAVRDAKCEFYYITVRRHALKKVRNLIGAEAYYSGNLPPYIPTWRFREME